MRSLSLVLPLLLASPALAAPQGDARMLGRIDAADANHDGAITKAELLAFRSANFERIDRNRDGVLAVNDIPAFLRGHRAPVDFATLLIQFDTDRNGRVTRAEFVDAPTVMFDRADANHDGVLTNAERQAAVAAANALRGG